MKAITFEGKQYEVEDWVKWVARDADGNIHGYSHEPMFGIGSFFHDFGCQKCFIGKSNWQGSLTEV